MVRITLLWIFISFLCVYSFRDWYKSLCGLIVMMAIIEHPDMPKTILGIPGFNPWNLVFIFVLTGWYISRKKEHLVWDMPKNITILLMLYALFTVVGFFRMTSDGVGLANWTASPWAKEATNFTALFSEYFLNTFKWVVPGLLIFHGCRSKSRILWATSSILLMYLLLAIQIIRWMPLDALTNGNKLEYYGLKFLSTEVGYHRVNLSMLMSGAFWAFVSSFLLYPSKIKRMISLSLPTVFLALALTGGRMGYATWAAIGGIIASVRWRKYLIWGPIFVILLIIFLPAVQQRMTAGFNKNTIDESKSVEKYVGGDTLSMQLYTITSGRSFAWPFVWQEIEKHIWFGTGREGMVRSGLSLYLLDEYGESFPHPHNASLQWIFDNGIIGFIPIIIFHILLLKYSFSLVRAKDDPVYVAIGGMAFSLIAALLIASIGSQTFYPREGAVPMWAAIGLLLRVYLERKKCNKRSSIQANIKPFWR